MGRLRYRASTRVKIAVAMLAGGLLTAPIAALAGHQFIDVPNSHPFHKEIGVVADAGIAQGFSDGTYRPSANLTRQAMAAFLERAVGRVGVGAGAGAIGNGGGYPARLVVTKIGMDAGATGEDTTGYVLVTATANVYANTSETVADCPCQVLLGLTKNGIQQIAGYFVEVPGVAGESGVANEIVALQGVAAMTGDETASFQLFAELWDSEVGAIGVTADITALYVPLGPNGDDSPVFYRECNIGYESEPNNSTGTADPFGAADCVVAFLSAADSDFFTVTVPAGHTLTLETQSYDGSGCEGDTTMTLYDGTGFVIATADDGGLAECSKIVQPGLAAGTYFVSVQAGNPTYSFEYRLSATTAP